jgi:ubiquinone/menaquinone biosynthesis C-methylase UbiE
MGFIFDSHAAKLYGIWRQSTQGKAMERLAEACILSLLDPQPGERILDIGCGTGNHLIFFNSLGLDINGIDASPYMINHARERLGSRCSLRTGSANDLPFEDNEFDLAVLINTLEFLDDPVQALREAGRVANRNVFIGVMNSLSWYCLLNKLQGLFKESLLNHVRFYHLWELKTLVRRAFGPVPVSWKSTRFWPPVSDRVKYWPFGSFLGLAATMTYRVKTDNLPLKIRVGKARQSIAQGLTMGKQTCDEGVHCDERGLFI